MNGRRKITFMICWMFLSLSYLMATDIKIKRLQSDGDSFLDGSYITLTNNALPKRIRRDATPAKPLKTSKLDKEAKSKIQKYYYPLKEDKNHDISLVWLGDKRETQILMTTTSHSTLFALHDEHPTKLYQSTNGGQTFESLNEKVGKNIIRENAGISKSPVDNKRMIIVVYKHASFFEILKSFGKTQKSSIIVTMDAAKSFNTYTLPFKIRDGQPIRFHPKNKDWLLALEALSSFRVMGAKAVNTGTAWLSKNFGKTWNKLFENELIEDVKWGTKEGNEDYIFALTKDLNENFMLSGFLQSVDTTLFRSTDLGKSFKKIVESCKSFGVQGEFVFATVSFKEKGNDTPKRVVHISKDDGTTFHSIHLPAVNGNQFYAILEMHKGLIFLHLDEEDDTGKGALYLSGPEGRMYTKSLDNHFYTNSGFTDFYRVESMEGVYITQKLSNEKTLMSVITLNRGQTWQPIKVDDKYCLDADGKKMENCSLHYHHVFSKTQHPLLASAIQAPLSVANAPGIILLHGQPGDALNKKMDVWMSRNGGYDWDEVAKGAHHYAIGDNGNLIVIVPKFNSTGTSLKYSIDQGRSWNEYQFRQKNQPLLIQGLVTEPHSQERSFSLWGSSLNASASDRVWEVVTIDFSQMFSRKCENKDFENWSPHITNGKGGCFLGVVKTFKRPKEDAVCYLGKDFNPVVTSNHCKCTKDDLQCDYGYERAADNSCVRNKKYGLIICKNGVQEKESFSKGYTLVSGDECEATGAISTVKEAVNVKRTGKECKEENIIGIVEQERAEAARKVKEARLKALRDQAAADNEQKELEYEKKLGKKKKSSAGIVVGLLAVVVVLAVGIFGYRRYQSRGGQQFVMSRLQEEDDVADETVDTFDPRPTSQRPYKDESDIDDEQLLPV